MEKAHPVCNIKLRNRELILFLFYFILKLYYEKVNIENLEKKKKEAF